MSTPKVGAIGGYLVAKILPRKSLNLRWLDFQSQQTFDFFTDLSQKPDVQNYLTENPTRRLTPVVNCGIVEVAGV